MLQSMLYEAMKTWMVLFLSQMWCYWGMRSWFVAPVVLPDEFVRVVYACSKDTILQSSVKDRGMAFNSMARLLLAIRHKMCLWTVCTLHTCLNPAPLPRQTLCINWLTMKIEATHQLFHDDDRSMTSLSTMAINFDFIVQPITWRLFHMSAWAQVPKLQYMAELFKRTGKHPTPTCTICMYRLHGHSTVYMYICYVLSLYVHVSARRTLLLFVSLVCWAGDWKATKNPRII